MECVLLQKKRNIKNVKMNTIAELSGTQRIAFPSFPVLLNSQHSTEVSDLQRQTVALIV